MRNPGTFVSEHMPVYSGRIARAENSLQHGRDESKFHMHDGEALLRKAERFFGRRSAGEPNCLLDIGCGFGGTIRYFAQRADFARTVGVDVQQEVIQLADRFLTGCDVDSGKKCAPWSGKGALSMATRSCASRATITEASGMSSLMRLERSGQGCIQAAYGTLKTAGWAMPRPW
ncbi:methyltransferase domain-containing protein [Streptomyces sp. NPDC053367]|uniref:methyltransferase domain-containing protein n=1 Tax=Streptomyces sp. NPDC053367 TaxID=3365700 RepID=UPI0037D07C18